MSSSIALYLTHTHIYMSFFLAYHTFELLKNIYEQLDKEPPPSAAYLLFSIVFIELYIGHWFWLTESARLATQWDVRICLPPASQNPQFCNYFKWEPGIWAHCKQFIPFSLCNQNAHSLLCCCDKTQSNVRETMSVSVLSQVTVPSLHWKSK